MLQNEQVPKQEGARIEQQRSPEQVAALGRELISGAKKAIENTPAAIKERPRIQASQRGLFEKAARLAILLASFAGGVEDLHDLMATPAPMEASGGSSRESVLAAMNDESAARREEQHAKQQEVDQDMRTSMGPPPPMNQAV